MKIAILGGGISGLSAAWQIQKRFPEAKITLFEKEDRIGGSIETVQCQGFTFEGGPRTFVWERSPALQRLLKELDLLDRLVLSEKTGKTPYFWYQGKLRSGASFFPKLIWALLKEPFQPRGEHEETVRDFITRRLGKEIAESVVDAMLLGIYAQGADTMPISYCFPSLQKEKRAWIRLLFRKKKRQLFTLQGGMQTLVDRLQNKLEITWRLGTCVERLTPKGVVVQGKEEFFDQVVSALPAPVIARLTGFSKVFGEVDLELISVGFSSEVLPKKGFGYLIPSKEKEALLGMVWDSCIFPGMHPEKSTCLSAMIRKGGGKEALKKALKGHLNISASANIIYDHWNRRHLPEFSLGHLTKVRKFRSYLKEQHLRIHLLGNFLEGGPSVEACLASSEEVDLRTLKKND